jgi:hypothetical protein
VVLSEEGIWIWKRYGKTDIVAPVLAFKVDCLGLPCVHGKISTLFEPTWVTYTCYEQSIATILRVGGLGYCVV